MATRKHIHRDTRSQLSREMAPLLHRLKDRGNSVMRAILASSSFTLSESFPVYTLSPVAFSERGRRPSSDFFIGTGRWQHLIRDRRRVSMAALSQAEGDDETQKHKLGAVLSLSAEHALRIEEAITRIDRDAALQNDEIQVHLLQIPSFGMLAFWLVASQASGGDQILVIDNIGDTSKLIAGDLLPWSDFIARLANTKPFGVVSASRG